MNEDKKPKEYYFVDIEPVDRIKEISSSNRPILSKDIESITDEKEIVTYLGEIEIVEYKEMEQFIKELGLELHHKSSEYRRINLLASKSFLLLFNRNAYYNIEGVGGYQGSPVQWRIVELYMNEHEPSLTIAHTSLKDIVTETYKKYENNIAEVFNSLLPK